MFKKDMASNFPYLPYKSLAISLLFSIFCGPLGLLYSSLLGGSIMLVVAIVVLSSHYPFPVVLMWLGCSIWAVAATNRYNRKLMTHWLGTKHEEKNHPTTAVS